MRTAVPALIQELQEACRLSLYNGNSLGLEVFKKPRDGSNPSTTKRRRQDVTSTKPRDWETILMDAAAVLPYVTDYEHGQILRLASILLLGFFLPRSTGNEYFIMQNLSSRIHSTGTNQQSAGSQVSEWTQITNETLGEYIIHMSLEERLASVPHKYCADNFGELDSIVEEHLDASLCSFIQRALTPLLSARPTHTQQVDLLHVIAMAIHPHPSEQPLRATIGQLEDKQSEMWSKTQRLMNSLVPHNFHVNYRHRSLLVQVVADHLVLPKFNKEQEAIDAPLYEGALPHLRASLYAFGMTALNPYDAHWSQCGLVSVAVQCGIPAVVKDEWGRLLNRLMDDRTHYGCMHSPNVSRRHGLSFMTERAFFCPHQARGRLLEVFLTRFNKSRNSADLNFLQHALSSLSDAIEFKVDCWTKHDDDDDDKNNHAAEETDQNKMKQTPTSQKEETSTMEGADQEMTETDSNKGLHDIILPPLSNNETSEPPCVLASLLVAAKSLFYFLPTLSSEEGQSTEEQSDDSHHRDMLVSCGIQLLHHGSHDVVLGASNLLALAFSYGPEKTVRGYAGALFSSLSLATTTLLASESNNQSPSFHGLLATVCRILPALGQAILESLFTLNRSDSTRANMIDCLISVVATACPGAVTAKSSQIVKLMEDDTTTDQGRSHLLAGLLACRRAYFFNKSNDEIEACTIKFIHGYNQGWDLYLIGRQALVSGNFDAAQRLYDELTLLSTSEHNFLWLSALQKIALAESILLSDGAKGIPNASIHMRSAASSILSLPSFLGPIKANFEFQLQLLNLRLDFLDIVCTIRQLTSEMRLTNVGPQKYTRPSLHLKSSLKLLHVLGSKYLSLYRQRGLFLCQQSRSSIRTLHALCRFVADAARSAFLDDVAETSADGRPKKIVPAIMTQLQGDSSHPLTVLMKRLDAQVLQDLGSAVEARIRAAALLQIIDGVLKVPIPFPRSFLRTKPIPRVTYRLCLDPETSEDQVAMMDDEMEEEVEVGAGTLISLVASGSIPEELVQQADIPFCTILLWYTVKFHSSHSSSGKNGSQADQERPDDDNAASTTAAAAAVAASDTKSIVGNSSWNAVPLSVVGETNPAPTAAVSLSPKGRFFVQIECETILMEVGQYTIETRLGCRDVRGGEWELPVEHGSQHAIPILVVSSRSS